MRLVILLFIAIISIHSSIAQNGLSDEMKDTEDQLNASNKQVNQFFRRFNGEEDENGKRYFDTDKKYRDPALRKKYVTVLFETQSGQIESNVAQHFIKKITDKKAPSILDFHQDDWFAEVNTTFKYKGKEIYGILYMRLQQQGQGYEWIIDDVSFSQFSSLFAKDTTSTKKFMHPMSHELDFMTLRKAFVGNSHAEQFTNRKYKPDFLSIFIYEMNLGNLKFETVNKVTFHFFSIDGYYFSLSNFNRTGYNSGWLISNLTPLANNAQKQQLKNYLYDKK
jgi:hypothetical protein